MMPMRDRRAARQAGFGAVNAPEICARELDVEGGQPAGVVRRERDAHLAPADVEVGMVVGALGEEADAHDERDRVGERRALERPDDLVAGALPARQRRRARPRPRRR